MTSQRLVPIILVIIGASSFGFLSSLIKLAYGEGFTGPEVTVAQITIGAMVMWLVFLLQPKAWANPFKGPWIALSLIGIFGLAATTVLYNTALSEMDASFSIILLFQFTWMTMLMESIRSRTWPSRGRVLALVFILLGTGLAVNIFAIDWKSFTIRGILFGIGSAVTYSLFLFASGLVKTDWSPLLKSVIMLTAGVPVIWFVYSLPDLSQPNAASLVLWGCILGLFGQVIPNVMFMIGIPRIGSSLAAVLGAMELPVGIVGAFLILHEQVALIQWIGIAMILVGIMTAEIRFAGRKNRAEVG